MIDRRTEISTCLPRGHGLALRGHQETSKIRIRAKHNGKRAFNNGPENKPKKWQYTKTQWAEWITTARVPWSQHFEVSLGKIQYPKLLLKSSLWRMNLWHNLP